MNIETVEPTRTRDKGTCCGDSFYGVLPVEEVKERMRERAAEMPVEDVAVYCVSCVKAMHIGDKRPRYLMDLLFGEETGAGIYERPIPGRKSPVPGEKPRESRNADDRGCLYALALLKMLATGKTRRD